MSTSAAAVLEAVEGGRVALQGVNVEAELRDLLAQISVTQTYKNEEGVNIEAVYTFPLPLDAVLLDLTVTLGQRTLTGHVVERSSAEERYEDAITDGDTAVLLQQVEPGLYTMNVGNLQAGETAVIRFRYALLQRWSGDGLRFMLPTTIAPRYGDPGRRGLMPHQQPEYDLSLELGYSLRVVVSGILADGGIDSPSHTVSIAREYGRAVIQLARGGAALDRDFVLNFHARDPRRACAGIERDLNGYIALASFKPEFGAVRDDSPRSVKIVVDCSGSMGGDSIAQAREALLRILGSLRAQDHFNILAFGSHYETLFQRQVPAIGANLARARGFVRGLDADMGGTKIGEALSAAYGLESELDVAQDLLLITDGEIWDADTVVRRAEAAGHRIFTVGVGSAVAEAFVRRLAEACGGACELVSPRENMAERIHRHFQRMYSPRAEDVAIEWPVEPRARFPEALGGVYEGDTIHAFAWFDDLPRGDVNLTVTLSDRRHVMQKTAIAPLTEPVTAMQAPRAGMPSTLARLGAAAKLKILNDASQGAELATQYQLISPWTHYLVIDVREEDEKADGLPALRKVPQMLAAGWGGLGTVHGCMSVDALADFERYDSRSATAEGDYFDIPAFLRRPDKDEPTGTYTIGPSELVKAINRLPVKMFVPSLRIDTLGSLRKTGLPETVVVALRQLVDAGADEKQVVVQFLYLVVMSEFGKGLKREAQRAIRRAYKDLKPEHGLDAKIESVLSRTAHWGGDGGTVVSAQHGVIST